MTADEVIRFGQLRKIIDQGGHLNANQQGEYDLLQPRVKLQLPTEPTAIMRQLVANAQFKAFVQMVAKQVFSILLKEIPNLIKNALKK